MPRGTIWPEYWIGCCKCDFDLCLATSKSPARKAKRVGWRRHGDSMNGPWICPSCHQIETEVASAA